MTKSYLYFEGFDQWVICVCVCGRDGSLQKTPAHNYSQFKFRTYAPLAFRKFRNIFEIEQDKFLVSLCAEPMRELSNPGVSGSIFYLTQGKYRPLPYPPIRHHLLLPTYPFLHILSYLPLPTAASYQPPPNLPWPLPAYPFLSTTSYLPLPTCRFLPTSPPYLPPPTDLRPATYPQPMYLPLPTYPFLPTPSYLILPTYPFLPTQPANRCLPSSSYLPRAPSIPAFPE